MPSAGDAIMMYGTNNASLQKGGGGGELFHINGTSEAF